MDPLLSREGRIRMEFVVHGAVQGIGFRPFVYRLANELGLAGFVRNEAAGVLVAVEGAEACIAEFAGRLAREAPARSIVTRMESTRRFPEGAVVFEIEPSEASGESSAFVQPDIATCSKCLRELFDSNDRRYRYPFTNCSYCGPRFSIIEALPYDRENTTMAVFHRCDSCRREYGDPSSRRFHAQPIACPDCGPQLELWDSFGRVLKDKGDALHAAVAAIREGVIVAVKGIGGFHLLADARSDVVVQMLRDRKQRPHKPFAVMFPSLKALKVLCECSSIEEQLLTSAEAPIVLVRRRSHSGGITMGVAPGNPWIGAILPYSPLHHLLLHELGFPVVATSGNLADEPICISETQAIARLGSIADLFLVHNRTIVRPVDDSIVRVIGGRDMMLRRARGFAPLPLALPERTASVLALGAQQKSSIAYSVGNQAFISQHLGDMKSPDAQSSLCAAICDAKRLFNVVPSMIARDSHPDYATSGMASKSGTAIVEVQHHYAHVLSCMAEHRLNGPVLGIAWDGAGLGIDGTIWGGEFLRIQESGFERVARLRTFRLPGGEVTAREPRRCAIGMLHEICIPTDSRLDGLGTFTGVSPFALSALRQMLQRQVNSPVTSSAGRLFDAVCSILDIRQSASFEGQAAMELEAACDGYHTNEAYPMPLHSDGVLDWRPTILSVLDNLGASRPVGEIATIFHNTLAEAVVRVACRVNERRVVLSGGCFQNKYLAERVVHRLREESFEPYWHRFVPPNDGGISLGQLMAGIQAQRR